MDESNLIIQFPIHNTIHIQTHTLILPPPIQHFPTFVSNNPSPSPSSSSSSPQHIYALTVLFFIPFLACFSLSFSRNLRCSSALNLPNLASRCSFFSLSAASFRSSAFSSSSSLRIFAICSSRVCLTRRRASGRKWAAETRWSGRRRK